MCPPATLVIPQFNHSHLTCECLRALGEWEPAEVEIIVVDDGSAAEFRALPDLPDRLDVRVVAQPHAGVSAAWNRGAAAARSPYLVFLNNDVLCEGPLVERLLAPLRAGRAVLTGAALRRERGLPAAILGRLGTGRFVEGWCMAVARDDFQAVGGFDVAMALYWSDTDFQARLLQHSGGGSPERIAAVAGLPVRHLSHQTARHVPRRRAIWRTDRETFIKKWQSRQGCPPRRLTADDAAQRSRNPR